MARWTHAQREAKARELGFASAYERRQVTKFANESKDFRHHVGQAGGKSHENLAQARLYWQAFGPKADAKDYKVRTRNGKPVVGKDGKGAKAKWLIDVAGYVGDVDEWKMRYPNGVRG